MDKQHSSSTKDWEREVLEKLVFSALKEQKTSRRWGIFFKFMTFSYLIAILLVIAYPHLESDMTTGSAHTAVIDIIGEIGPQEIASADNVIQGLRAASKDGNTKGIILNINSPGGSPVQSANIYDEIKRLKLQNPEMPIYAVVNDLCASGGYYVASAADKIYVNQASLIGSIGVIMNGFGFTQSMDKLGVERRLLTAGEHKAMLDPFSPVKAQETQHMQTLLNQVHQQFIDAVKQGRGDRLKTEKSHELFSGLVWTGSESIQLGLADEIGSVDSVSRNVIGVEKLENFTSQEKLLDRLAGKFGTSFGHAFSSQLSQPAIR